MMSMEDPRGLRREPHLRFQLRQSVSSRIPFPLASWIGVVLLLTVLALGSLQSTATEGDFQRHLPALTQAGSANNRLAEIRVGLRSDANGALTEITVGQYSLGGDAAAFERLNAEILRLLTRTGNPLPQAVEVEIDSDYELRYEYVIRAVAACSGRIDPQTKELVRFVERIKFTPPHRPKAASPSEPRP
ncbi:MAG: biopolymer transporter ExbD [Planctomycetaceae bacterium]|nr:biopolymer transporter ExbD [Planctomycetaceae bacterium]